MSCHLVAGSSVLILFSSESSQPSLSRGFTGGSQHLLTAPLMASLECPGRPVQLSWVTLDLGPPTFEGPLGPLGPFWVVHLSESLQRGLPGGWGAIVTPPPCCSCRWRLASGIRLTTPPLGMGLLFLLSYSSVLYLWT